MLSRAGAARTASNRWPAAVAGIVECRPSEVFVASTGVIGEPLDVAPILGCPAGTESRRIGEPVGRGGARHHDDRHLCQGMAPSARLQRHDGFDQRHRQGIRHDRPRHGDDARLPVHRRRRAGPRPATAARPQRGQKSSLHHRGQRYLDLRHGPVRCHRQHRAGADGAQSPSTIRA